MLTLLRSKFKKAETDTQRNMHSYALSKGRRITYQKQAGYAYAKQLIGTPRLKNPVTPMSRWGKLAWEEIAVKIPMATPQVCRQRTNGLT